MTEQRIARVMSSASTRGTSIWGPSAPTSPDAFISVEEKHPTIQYRVVGPFGDSTEFISLRDSNNSKNEIAE
jgi:hypothetical protein